MTSPASDSLSVILTRLDARVRRVDEERWLSSRYASKPERETLTVLYALYYELARVRVAVSDQTMGQIRFQWWRDALDELSRGEVRQHDVALALEEQIKQGRLAVRSLSELVEQHEAAFLAEDRDHEPEALLAQIAARVCDPNEDRSAVIAQIAPEWARLRRGETVEARAPVVRVSAKLRPALVHLRLRQAWARGQMLGPLRTRLSILRAIMSGRI